MKGRNAMALGYSKPLYLLAFDHRGSFERDLFSASHSIPDKVRAGITDAKEVLYEGFVAAAERGVPSDEAGILVDEQYETSVACKARSAGHVLAMPVEKSGQADFEYGEEFGRPIEEFDPTFAKVLVRYNPDGDKELNHWQTERLARLSTWLHDRDQLFLFELLVPATAEQLNRAGGDQRRYDREIRPGLVVRTIRAMQDEGAEPVIWKIEGLDSVKACTQVLAAARRGGRDQVCCIVLGRGADEPQVIEWLRIAASVPGFDGFVVGRALWEQSLDGMIAGTIGAQRSGGPDRRPLPGDGQRIHRLALGLTGPARRQTWLPTQFDCSSPTSTARSSPRTKSSLTGPSPQSRSCGRTGYSSP
jgi:myo-inositol catabolism protein IolC